MKQPSSVAIEPPIIFRKVSNGTKDRVFHYEDLTASSTKTMENEETKTLLRRMCHLLESRIHKEEEQRFEADKENEMKNDWMLAAAVLDRICAIAVTVIYVVGTVILFVMFATNP